MDLTYKQDHMYIDGEAVNIPNAAAVYAGLLVEGIQRSMEYSPRFQREFWELMRPSAAAYYDWRITPSELVADYEESISSSDSSPKMLSCRSLAHSGQVHGSSNALEMSTVVNDVET